MKFGESLILQYVYQNGKGFLKLAEGLITERPSFISNAENYDRNRAYNGMMRYNSTEDLLEVYVNNRWTQLISDRDFTENTIPPGEDSRELTFETLGNVLSDLQRNVSGYLELSAAEKNTGVLQKECYNVINGSIGEKISGYYAYRIYGDKPTYNDNDRTYETYINLIVDPFSVSGFEPRDRWDLKYTAWASLTKTYLNFDRSYNASGAMVYIRPLWEMNGYNQVDEYNRLINYGKFFLKIGIAEGMNTRDEDIIAGIKWYCNMFRYTNFKIPKNIYVPPEPNYDIPEEVYIEIKSHTQLNLNSYMSKIYPLWESNEKKCDITVTIYPDVLIYSPIGGPALYVGKLPDKTTVKIINKGRIIGIGGYGGHGGDSTTELFPRILELPQNGNMGGNSIEVTSKVKINNADGIIYSPGGGGGGAPALIYIANNSLRKRFIGGSSGGSGAYLGYGRGGGIVSSSVDYDKTTRIYVDRKIIPSKPFEFSGLSGGGSGEQTGGKGNSIPIEVDSSVWKKNTFFKRSDVILVDSYYYSCAADHTSRDNFNVTQQIDLVPKEIIDGWYRFAHSTNIEYYFPLSNSGNYSSNADVNSWTYDATNKTITCVSNNNAVLGIVSPYEGTTYSYQVRVSSDSTNDGNIGVIIAHVTVGTKGQPGYKEHTLSAIRGCNGTGIVWQLIYNYGQDDQRLIEDLNSIIKNVPSNSSGKNGWAEYPTGTKIEFVRHGDTIMIMTNELGEENISYPLATMNITLDGDLSIFNKPSRFGLIANAQPNATWNFDYIYFECWKKLYPAIITSGDGGSIGDSGGEQGSPGMALEAQQAQNGLVFYDNLQQDSIVVLNGVPVPIQKKDTLKETVDAFAEYLNSADREEEIRSAIYDRFTYTLGTDIIDVDDGIKNKIVEVIQITYKETGSDGNKYTIKNPYNLPFYPSIVNVIYAFTNNPPNGSIITINGSPIVIGTTVPRGSTLGETLINVEYYVNYINWVDDPDHAEWPIWNNDRRINRVYTKYLRFNGKNALGFEFHCVDLTTFDTRFNVTCSWEEPVFYDVSSLTAGIEEIAASKGGLPGNAIKGISNVTWIDNNGNPLSGPNGIVKGTFV